MPFIFCSSLLIVLLEIYSNSTHSNLNMHSNGHSIIHHTQKNTHILHYSTINHPSKPQTKMKPPLHISSILYILQSLFNTNILCCIILLCVSLPLLCESHSITTPPASMLQIDELINGGTSRDGELCSTMGNCEYLTSIETQQDTLRGYIECASDQVCILICDAASPCKLLDVFADTNTVLIIDCIDSLSCDELQVHAEDSYFVYLEGNDQHSIFKSQIQCPIDNHITETNQSSCIVHGNCIDIDGKSHCKQDFIDPMISWLSIYSYSGYNDLELKCDQNDANKGSWCFDDNNFILCGSSDAAAQQTCWIDYDIDYDQYICDGDDIQRNILKCTDDFDHIDATTFTIDTDESIQVSKSAFDAFIQRISSNKHILYIVIGLSVLFCCCCIFGVALCTYTANHRQSRDKKNNRHQVLAFETPHQSCCDILRKRSRSVEDDTGTVDDTEQQRTQITVTTDIDDQLSIKKLPIGLLRGTSNTIESSRTMDAQMNDGNRGNHHTLQIKYTSAQSATPLPSTTTTHDTPNTATNLKDQQSSSGSAHLTHFRQNTGSTFDRYGTYVTDSNHVMNGEAYKQPSCSHLSLKSHTDDIEAQAAKKLCDAKLGYKANSTSYHCTTTYGNQFDYGHDAFGVATDNGFAMDEDYKFALQIQQEQIYKCAQGHKAIQSLQISSHKSKSSTPFYDNNNNDTPYMKHDVTPNTTPHVNITHPSDESNKNRNTITDGVLELDLGGGIKIGVYEESSTNNGHPSPTGSGSGSGSGSCSNSTFDPEHPHHDDYE